MQKPPSLLVVEGESGVGKSRLVRELCGMVEPEGIRTRIGYCHDLREPFPLGPILGAVERAVPKASRQETFVALAASLDSTEPCLLVLEDAQWIDEVTLDFLTFLTGRFPPALSVLLTVRRPDVDAKSSLFQYLARASMLLRREDVVLEPLSIEETGTLAAMLLETDLVSDEFGAYLHEHTGGLPFLVEELLRLLRDRKDLVLSESGWTRREIQGLPIPTALVDSVVERLRRLSAHARLVVQGLAVIGVPTQEDVISGISHLDEDEVAWALGEALRSGLVKESADGYELRHALARKAVYEAMESPERTQLHLRAARTLAGHADRPVAQIAHHFAEANRADEFLRYADEAVQVASASGEARMAFELLARMIEVQEDPSRRIELAFPLAESATKSLAHEEGIRLLEDMASGPFASEEEEAGLRHALARLLCQATRFPEARTQLRLALPALEASHPGKAGRIAVLLALPVWDVSSGQEEYRNWLSRAGRIRATIPDPATVLGLTIDEAAILRYLGDARAAETIEGLPRIGATREERAELARGYRNLAEASLHAGFVGDAEKLFLLGEDNDEEDFIRNQVHRDTSALRLDFARGEWGDLEYRARSVAARAESDLGQIDAEMVLGPLLLATGRVDEAAGILSSLRSRIADTGPTDCLALASAALARILLFRRRTRLALTTSVEPLESLLSRDLGALGAPLFTVATACLVRAGETERAFQLVASLERAVEAIDAPAAEAGLRLARATVSRDPAAADADLSEAVNLFAEMPRPYEAALAREAWGASRLDLGRPGGETLLSETLDVLRSLGASWDAKRVERRLRKAGVKISSGRRGRPSYGDDLSPREREVAELVATGMSNQQVADELFLSPRTVAHHIASALRKEGVTSRTALAARLRPTASN